MSCCRTSVRHGKIMMAVTMKEPTAVHGPVGGSKSCVGTRFRLLSSGGQIAGNARVVSVEKVIAEAFDVWETITVCRMIATSSNNRWAWCMESLKVSRRRDAKGR